MTRKHTVTFHPYQDGEAMSTKVVVNLATGMEDPERVMIAFLVGQAAAAKGKHVTMFLTKDAVHLAVPGHAPRRSVRQLPADRAAVRTIRRSRRRTARLSDLREVTRTGGHHVRHQRHRRRRHPTLGVDRRRGSDGLQLLKRVRRVIPRGDPGVHPDS